MAERRDATTQKVILNRKDIENLGVMTVGEVLGKLPGVELGSGGMGHRTRGMSRDSVQVLIDGERSAGGGSMVGIVGRLPSGELERVEIIRGSSAEFGGAASVTVNLIMKKALPKSSTEIRVGIGRKGSESFSQLALTKTGGEGGFAWSLPIGLMWNNFPISNNAEKQDNTSHTYESERGTRKMGHHTLTPRMTWKDGNDSLTVAPMYFFNPQDSSGETTLSGSAIPADNGVRVSTVNGLVRMTRLRVDGEKHVGDSKLTSRASVSNRKNTTDTVRTGLTNSTDHNESREIESNFAFRLDKPLGAEHLVAVGLEYINLRLAQDQSFSGSAASYAAHEKQSIAWIQDDWVLQPKTTLTYGLRGETITLDSSGASQQRGQVMPSLAIRMEPADKWVMRSSLGAGLKMPKLGEISNAATLSVGTNTPVEADVRGNPNLLPERSINFEAVMERYLDAEAGVLGANLYVRSTRDFTERRVQQEGTRWVDRPQNEGSAMHWGFELDGKIRTDNFGWKGATLKSHLTLPHAQVKDERLGITRMAQDTPKYVFSAGLDETLPSLQSSYGITLQLSGRSVTDIPGEKYGYTKARTTVDAFWLYRFNPKFKLRVSGQNLLATDTERSTRYMSGGDTWQLNAVEHGYRSLVATLEGRW
ncbi:MAG: TonB-dependent receptor [Gammaproteobacteria bacterium]|nr:TonB-dependent receptor [Gammaproteobacteria bacterium]MBU1967797.1 TonB-dependent receptor [Gammaproteobacteria bacterium]